MGRYALTALAAAAVLTAGCGASNSGPAQPTTETASPVTAAALDGLLLDDADAQRLTGVKSMETTTTASPSTVDDGAGISDAACLFAANPFEDRVYSGSGWTATRAQVLSSSDFEDPNPVPFVSASLVLFPSATAAAAFFDGSVTKWPACANRQFTLKKYNGEVKTWAIGSVSNTDGVLSVTRTNADDKCQSALTVENNVVVDVESCGRGIGDPRAVDLAKAYAAKIPNK